MMEVGRLLPLEQVEPLVAGWDRLARQVPFWSVEAVTGLLGRARTDHGGCSKIAHSTPKAPRGESPGASLSPWT